MFFGFISLVPFTKRCQEGLNDCLAYIYIYQVADPVLRSVFDCGSISFVFHQKSHKVEAKKKTAEEKDEDYRPEEDVDDED